jgi:hypothetical protein
MSIFKFIEVHSSTQAPACRNCVHFQNDPIHIETVYPGLTIMSSGFASVRDRDGLCTYHQLYLSATDSCPDIKVLLPGSAC